MLGCKPFSSTFLISMESHDEYELNHGKNARNSLLNYSYLIGYFILILKMVCIYLKLQLNYYVKKILSQIKMKKLYILIIATLFIGISLSCNKNNPREEKWIVQNDTDHFLEIKTYSNGHLRFNMNINPNDTGIIPTNGIYSNPENSLRIKHSDSLTIQFDETKLYVFPHPPNKEYTVNYDIHFPDRYEVQDCEKRKRYCKRVFYITEEHYLQTDSL